MASNLAFIPNALKLIRIDAGEPFYLPHSATRDASVRFVALEDGAPGEDVTLTLHTGGDPDGMRVAILSRTNPIIDLNALLLLRGFDAKLSASGPVKALVYIMANSQDLRAAEGNGSVGMSTTLVKVNGSTIMQNDPVVSAAGEEENSDLISNFSGMGQGHEVTVPLTPPWRALFHTHQDKRLRLTLLKFLAQGPLPPLTSFASGSNLAASAQMVSTNFGLLRMPRASSTSEEQVYRK
ncbi:hypothetical protein V8E36_008929 [Tilletia maclaganii]